MKFTGKPLEIYDRVCEYLEKQKGDKEIIVFISNKETKEIRTAIQNNMFYGLFTEIGNHLGYTNDEVKQYFLSYFGIKEIDFFGEKRQINIKQHTSELQKEEAIFFIDLLLKFIENNNIPCKYTPKELQNLYESFNF